MTIYFNPAKDTSKPASLALKDRVDDKDIICLSECLWALTETKISIIGLLGEQSVGIEDYNDKSFKPSGQKVVFSFLRDENPVYDRDSKKTTIEPASTEQKVQFRVLHAALTKFQTESRAVCASSVLRPKVSALVAGAAEAIDDEAKSYFRFATKDMFLFTMREPDKLTGEDTDFINQLVAQKPGDLAKKSNWQSAPKETEAERLMARWVFIQSQFEDSLEIKPSTLPQLLAIINGQSDETEKAILKAAFNALLNLVAK
jgi:hypothetical protein